MQNRNFNDLYAFIQVVKLAALGDLRGKVSGRLRINTAENPAYYLI